MTTKSTPASPNRQHKYKKLFITDRFNSQQASGLDMAGVPVGVSKSDVAVKKGFNIRHTMMAAVTSFAMVGMALVVANQPVQAATGTMSLAPASGSYAVGANVVIEVREDSGTTAVNAAQADLTYSSNLQYVSIDDSTSDFSIGAAKSGGNGVVSIARGMIGGVTGNKLIAKVTFSVVSGGTASVQFANTSTVLSSADNTSVVNAMTGASYTLTGGGTTTPPTPPTPPTQPPTGPCNAATSDLGTDSITVTVPADATYSLWTRMIAPDTSHNSINLQVDATNCFSVGGGTFAAAAFADNTSNWVNYANGSASNITNVALTAGDHTFKYIGTAAGIGVDKILITSDATCIPTGMGDNCPSASTTPPTINLLTPAANSVATGPVSFTATATATSGVISSVKFLVDGQEVNTDTASPFSFTWNSATVANGTHTISAQATDGDGTTAVTAPITITTNNVSTCTGTPSVPASLAVAGTTADSISLTWGASTPASNCTIKEYKIYRNGNLVTSVTSGTTYQDTGLAPGGSFSYTIAAADTSGHVSAQSTAVTATTGTDAEAPSKPTNVRSTLISGTSVALAWEPSTDNSSVAGYVIYRAQGAVTTAVDTVVGNVSDASFSDSGLAANTPYTYVIKAKDVPGNLSAGSDPYTVTTSAATTTGASIYLKPDSGTFTLGQNVVVEVRENSGTATVNAVQADLAYSAANLQFVSADGAGSGFGIEAANPNTSAGNGTVSIPRGTTTATSGDQLISKVTFKVIGTGTGSIEVSTSSVLLSDSTNADIAGQRLGAGYTLVNEPVTPPNPPNPPVTPPNPTTPPANPPTPPTGTTTTPKTPTTTTRPSTGTTGATTTTTPKTPTTTSTTTIAPTGNSNPLPLTGGSEVELSDPAVIQTSTQNTSSIKMVEYLLNGKLVAKVTSPPYSYTVKTNNLRNGKYTLTTKTTYTSGKVDSSNSAIIVNNPMNITQIMLQLKHYAWVLILLALIAGGAIWFMFFRNGSGDEFGDDTDVSGGYGVPGMYDDPNVASDGMAGGQITPTMPPNMSPPGAMDMGPPGMTPPGMAPPGMSTPGAPPGMPQVPGQGGPDPYGRY